MSTPEFLRDRWEEERSARAEAEPEDSFPQDSYRASECDDDDEDAEDNCNYPECSCAYRGECSE